MHVQTHWAQEKDITKNGASHPTTTHTLQELPAPLPPTSSDTQSVYMCAHERGGLVVWKKGGKVPIRRLLNTFVSTTRRDKPYGELLRDAATDAASCWEKAAQALQCFPPRKEKTVYFHDELGIDSRVLSQCTGGWFF